MTNHPHERLRQARIEAKYETASGAAIAMGVRIPTYINHENGTAGLSRAGARYARFFGVSLDWLLTGKGPRRPPAAGAPRAIPVTGLVGAGASVEMIGDTSGHDAPYEIEMPGDGRLRALQVRGDSQWPRFADGEFILYDSEPVLPASLIGQYAVVQCADGRRLIKILRRALGEAREPLGRPHAPPQADVELIGAWRYLGVLPSPRSRP